MADRGVLLVAYHFPPIQGSSGFQRALSLARYLPDSGWKTHILTAALRAYEQVTPDGFALVPPGTEVHRAWAVDSKRHLSINGRYFNFLEIPDRWQSWILPGIVCGASVVKRQRLDVVFSTYPIASAHVIGYGISRWTGQPWVVDLRDPMLQDDVPQGRLRRRSFAWIEQLIFRHASRVVVTTQGCAGFYIERYGDAARERMVVIGNGYDEGLFPERRDTPRVTGRRLKILHSGLVYKHGRDPANLFEALRSMLGSGEITEQDLSVVFRAPGSEVPLMRMIEESGLGNMVSVEPPVSYADALREMLESDGLLVLQGDNCNHQIPAKVYEYLYAGTPIIGLATPQGDTGRLLDDLGITALAPLEDWHAIRRMLNASLPKLREGTLPQPTAAAVARLSRRERTREFARLFDGLVSS